MARPSSLKKQAPESVRIDSVSHDGRGIATVGGKKVFVADVVRGEEVRIVRRKRRRSYDEAELLEVLQPAAARRVPRCAVFGVCGGCALQHVAPEEQRAIKENALRDNLQRIGGLEPQRWLPATANEQEAGSWNYRRRARLAVKDVPAKGRVLVGFRERNAPLVADMRRCEILEPPIDGLIDPLSELIGRLTIRNRLPQIEVAVADNAVELILRVLDPPSQVDRQLLRRFAEEHRLRLSLQSGGLDAIEPLYPVLPDATLNYDLPDFDVRLEFAAADFIQVNRQVNRGMVSQVVDLLQAGAESRVLDLYCGIGNFSLPLARRSARVLGVEGEERQVQRARSNAALNGIDRCEFLSADLAALSGHEAWLRAGWDRVLLDPPRSGAAELVGHLKMIAAPRLVYVSCHPGTLARDAGRLVREQGYVLEAAGIVDMFPHTAHVESIAVFSKT
ncbi:MAG: 23S rRNA (uracil(1939)-C(5))-methyltransferase RlmD [Woeseia sp.]